MYLASKFFGASSIGFQFIQSILQRLQNEKKSQRFESPQPKARYLFIANDIRDLDHKP